MKPKLLIIDDDEEIRTQMGWALAEDYDVFMAGDRARAMALFREQKPPVVLLDLGLPPHSASTEEGFAALSEVLSMDRLAKVIIIFGEGEKNNALQAIGKGAYISIAKPIDFEKLRALLKQTFQVARLDREMEQRLADGTYEVMLLGTSPQMQDVISSVRKVATTNAPVLILGESGTKKELVAQAIHVRSQRKEGPFAAINCSAIPETLLESELFGHEKGSFTGAHVQRKGRIESASGGTLFLDEIGDLPAPIQVKLLRFLQGQRIERVGGRHEIEVDTRIIAGTNAELEKAIGQGKFREDLYYRFAVVVIKLPALFAVRCNICEATVHIETAEPSPLKIHLCGICAAKIGVNGPAGFSLADLISAVRASQQQGHEGQK